jgi:uncharacterized protein (TIGR03435 family)
MTIGNLAAAGLVWLSSAASVLGQAGPVTAPEFDVASVKQLAQSFLPGQHDLSFVGTSGKPFKIAGNYVTIRGTLHTLMTAAYSNKSYQILALPEWAHSLIFEVSAKTPGESEPTQDEVRPMLQTLLVERFQLKLHHDAKEMQVYHLIQAKKSGAFKAAGPGETFSWKLTPDKNGTLRSQATKESIGDFVQLVGVSADRPVIDKTGITGEIDYDIVIELPQGERLSAEEVDRQIVYAVVDQLGLKLDKTKDMVDVLVVDSVEKPSSN